MAAESLKSFSNLHFGLFPINFNKVLLYVKPVLYLSEIPNSAVTYVLYG